MKQIKLSYPKHIVVSQIRGGRAGAEEEEEEESK